MMENSFRCGRRFALKKGCKKFILTVYFKSIVLLLITSSFAKAQMALRNMNINHMHEAYFCACSSGESNHYPTAYSCSLPQKIKEDDKFPTNAVSVNVCLLERDTFQNEWNGIRVYVANTTDRKKLFYTDQNRLFMKVQALDESHVWRNIEYFKGSSCGNAYYSIMLFTNHYWMFVVPVYEGSYKTKLRIELKYLVNEDDLDKLDFLFLPRPEDEVTVYSNIYEGSINPEQFRPREDAY